MGLPMRPSPCPRLRSGGLAISLGRWGLPQSREGRQVLDGTRSEPSLRRGRTEAISGSATQGRLGWIEGQDGLASSAGIYVTTAVGRA